MAEVAHIPVLRQEIIELFQPKDDAYLLDATAGHGGHLEDFLQAAGASSRAVAIDADEQALAVARQRLAPFGDRVTYLTGNFANMKDLVSGGEILHTPSFTHILFDLGIGSHQLGDESRGFSFQHGQTLTMAYGQHTKLPDAHLPALQQLERRLGRLPEAVDILYGLSVQELADCLSHYGEERYAYRVARAIKAQLPITSAKVLARIISAAVPAGYERGRINPATRTFQALRLAVNRELEALEAALPQAVDLLASGGVLAVISFHSLEDRIVKNFFRRASGKCICPPEQPVCTCHPQARVDIITRRPIQASQQETSNNPRARSAKLRAIRKKE